MAASAIPSLASRGRRWAAGWGCEEVSLSASLDRWGEDEVEEEGGRVMCPCRVGRRIRELGFFFLFDNEFVNLVVVRWPDDSSGAMGHPGRAGEAVSTVHQDCV